MKTVNLNHISIYPFKSKEDLIEFVEKEKGILIAQCVGKVMNSSLEDKKLYNRHICYADGIGIKKALQKAGHKDAIQIPGCELWLDIIKKEYSNKSFFFIGGKQKVIDDTVSKLKKQYPDINIKGFRNGYINSAEEKNELIKDIVTTKPDIIFVAMGSPAQEHLMEDLFSKHKAIYQGLGGSFDVFTGNVPRAPKWWREHGLEWLFRLLRQPKRINRYFSVVTFTLGYLTGNIYKDN